MARVRKAEAGDALQLAILAEKTFRDAFSSENTPENMDLHCRTHYSEAVQRMEIAGADVTTLVVEKDNVFLGYAQMRWGPAPASVAALSPAEIQRLYVSAEFHGKGIAQELMSACIKEAEARKCDAVWLGVWERNPRAISFYKKFGFAEVGEHVFPLGRDPQRDIVMARNLK